MVTRARSITYDYEPYFIIERERGIFYAIHKLIIQKRSFRYDLNSQIGSLTLGADITETSARGLELLVVCGKGVHPEPNIIEECRKFAEVAMHPFVSVETYGAAIGITVQEGERIIYVKVKPRLFRRVVNT